MSKISSKLKFVKLKDIVSIFQMLLVLPVALFCKIFIRGFWLICEDRNEARDNGYWFFKYVCENQPKQKVAYAINKKSVDYKKVKDLGKVISYGGWSHWFWYFVADKNISSQKGGKPNAAVCYILEVILKFRKNNRVFLQHGITINNVEFLYYKNTNMRLFITATTEETDFINEKFGYPEDYVQQLGFTRFDNLNDDLLEKDTILLMPTWRQWIAKGVETKDIEGSSEFVDTNYYKKWSEFLNSPNLDKILKKYNKKLLFYPHRNMQNFLHHFNTNSENIEICDWKTNDIQDVFHANLDITNIFDLDMSDKLYDYLNLDAMYYRKSEAERTKEGE